MTTQAKKRTPAPKTPKETEVKAPEAVQEVKKLEAPKPSQSELRQSSVELDHLKQINISDALETAFESPIESEGFSIGNEDPIENDNPIEPSGLLTRQQFYEMFNGTHTMASALSGLQSIKIRPDEKEIAKGASDAIYDTALEVEAFRFLIEPSNVWLQRAVAIGAYGYSKSQIVMAEIHLRKMKKAEGQAENQSKNPENKEGEGI